MIHNPLSRAPKTTKNERKKAYFALLKPMLLADKSPITRR